MTESEFNQQVDSTLEAIEELLDNEAETDLDYDTVGGVLTIICENRSQIIFTRQAPVKQLWVATVDGGYHFDFDTAQNTWVLDSDQTPLAAFLAKAFANQAGESFTFSF
ncbi:MAG: iron donor protein CyaY [Pontibacterium sp.]